MPKRELNMNHYKKKIEKKQEKKKKILDLQQNESL